MSINSVTISGNVGRAPELKSTNGGMQVLNFSVCVNGRVKRGDSWEDKPNWVDVSMFGRRAESVSRYIGKGSHITVHGRLNQRSWEKDGQKHSKLEVVADDIDFTGSCKNGGDQQADAYSYDIPF